MASASQTTWAEARVNEAVLEARSFSATWCRSSIAARLRATRTLRSLVARHALELADRLSPRLQRTTTDTLTAEIIPFADACRFLEREAAPLLAPTKLSGRSRPLWLKGVEVELHRDPLGTVLIIGPSNYPFFLPAVQTLQAMIAGNTVLWKPGNGGSDVAVLFRDLALQAGFPARAVAVLDEMPETAIATIRAGVDKIVLTGSVQTGRAVLAEAAETITPSIVELSGKDAMFVLAGADLEKASAALLFGRRLNGGATCIAPQRIFVAQEISARFAELLTVASAEASGVFDLIPFESIEDALRQAAECPYALGASIFGPESAVRDLARGIPAGVVTINDLIVPTADPRVSFGGSGLSGFGRTRGAEGLLQMTKLRTVITQRSKRLRHLEALPPNAEQIFLSYLQAAHETSWSARFCGVRDLVHNLMTAAKHKP